MEEKKTHVVSGMEGCGELTGALVVDSCSVSAVCSLSISGRGNVSTGTFVVVLEIGETGDGDELEVVVVVLGVAVGMEPADGVLGNGNFPLLFVSDPFRLLFRELVEVVVVEGGAGEPALASFFAPRGIIQLSLCRKVDALR